MMDWIMYTLAACLVLAVALAIILVVTCYRKVEQGTAIIRTGMGGTKVSFEGIVVLPVIHRMEIMDISVKRVEIERMGENGLVCRDNLRADVKVAFFVRVAKTPQDVLKVAQALGCRRASDARELVAFFDAKFSEALKTAGKQFDFTSLYTDRMHFKDEILKVIGTDLNGYALDDAAIDYLEQTPLAKMNPDNILDAEGIKKITDLTAAQLVLANGITREKEKTIKRQDVEAREKILELERQQAEAEQKQMREIAEVTARETAQAERIRQEEHLKAERARISTEEEVAVASENRDRQIVIAQRNRERTDQVETERVERDRALEATSREQAVALARIAKDKAVEVEMRAIQEVIRERVIVERTVVGEQEKIKDTVAFAGAERAKEVAVVAERAEAEKFKVKEVVTAAAQKEAERERAEQVLIEAEAKRAAALKETEARKNLADASAQEAAIHGVGEARAMTARAEATLRLGESEAKVTELRGRAEAEAVRAKAEADAGGITAKAEAMKLFHEAGREHEEFKIRLERDLKVDLASIDARREVAAQQASVLGAAFQTAKVEVIGGDGAFFDKLAGAVTGGKALDRWVENSSLLGEAREALFSEKGEDGESDLMAKLRGLAAKHGITAETARDATLAALAAKLLAQSSDDGEKALLSRIADGLKALGLADRQAAKLFHA